MKNDHLVPPLVIDLVERLNTKTLMENEKLNIVLRLEATRDYIDKAIPKKESIPFNKKRQVRR